MVKLSHIKNRLKNWMAAKRLVMAETVSLWADAVRYARHPFKMQNAQEAILQAIRKNDVHAFRHAFRELPPHTRQTLAIFEKPLIVSAVRNNCPEIELYLLEQGANPNTRIDGNPLLIHHLCSPDAETEMMVRSLLVHGANPNGVSDSFQHTALMWAVFCYDADVVRLLINFGADVNKQNLMGRTALMEAVMRNDLPTVQCLLKAGARTDVRDMFQQTVFDYQRYGTPELKALFQSLPAPKVEKGLNPFAEAVRITTQYNQIPNQQRQRRER